MNRLAPLLLAAAFFTGCATETPERPNLLILFADDQRTDALGAWGNEHIATPSLDALVAHGFSFRNAHVMGSHHGAVCAPSRAMLMSGRQLFRVYDNLDSVATFPERLRAHGYATFGTGKWHQSRASFARSFEAGRAVFFGGMSDHGAVPVRDLLPDSTYTEQVQKSFSTDVFADAAIAYLEERGAAVGGSDDRPFLAYVSFTVPHDPRTPPERWTDAYPDGSVPLPDNFMPVHPFHNGWMTGRDEQLAPWPRPADMIAEQLAEYYGLISHMDERIGDILAVLERTGLADETLVVFAADNGLALGSHGLLGKQSLYEHSNRVPLVVSGPGIPQGQTNALVALYDLFPTIAEWTGMEPTPGMDGSSLSPIWSGETPRVRDALYTAYEDLMRSVADERFKLIRYPKLGLEQLYDLENDPNELTNLVDEPAHAEVLSRLRERMRFEHQRHADPHPLEVDSLWSPEVDITSFRRSPDRWQPAWVVEKYFGQ